MLDVRRTGWWKVWYSSTLSWTLDGSCEQASFFSLTKWIYSGKNYLAHRWATTFQITRVVTMWTERRSISFGGSTRSTERTWTYILSKHSTNDWPLTLNCLTSGTLDSLTQATDTTNIRLVFAAVKETILQNALKDSGILWKKTFDRVTSSISPFSTTFISLKVHLSALMALEVHFYFSPSLLYSPFYVIGGELTALRHWRSSTTHLDSILALGWIIFVGISSMVFFLLFSLSPNFLPYSSMLGGCVFRSYFSA